MANRQHLSTLIKNVQFVLHSCDEKIPNTQSHRNLIVAFITVLQFEFQIPFSCDFRPSIVLFPFILWPGMPSFIPGCEEILFNKFRHAKNLLALSERCVQKYKGGGSSKYKEGLHFTFPGEARID